MFVTPSGAMVENRCGRYSVFLIFRELSLPDQIRLLRPRRVATHCKSRHATWSKQHLARERSFRRTFSCAVSALMNWQTRLLRVPVVRPRTFFLGRETKARAFNVKYSRSLDPKLSFASHVIDGARLYGVKIWKLKERADLFSRLIYLNKNSTSKWL